MFCFGGKLYQGPPRMFCFDGKLYPSNIACAFVTKPGAVLHSAGGTLAFGFYSPAPHDAEVACLGNGAW